MIKTKLKLSWPLLFVVLVINTVFTVNLSAQETPSFKVGQSIYVNAFYAGCVRATVKQAEPQYYVHIEEGTYKDRDVFYNADRLKECPQKTQPPANQERTDLPEKTPDTAQPPQNQGNLQVGDRVDIYLSGNREGKNRGTIIEINNNQYKIRYDGCAEKYDVWENSALAHPAAVISGDDPEIKFFGGKWSLTTVGISSDSIAWGSSPGIQINNDGSYIWYQDSGKAPVKGQWQPHAKIEGTRSGTETANGIIIYDAKGYGWKIVRRKSTLDNEDHITIRLMCSGETQMGTRAK